MAKLKKKKSLKLGSLVAVATPDTIYICKVIKIDKEIQGYHFNYVFFDELNKED